MHAVHLFVYLMTTLIDFPRGVTRTQENRYPVQSAQYSPERIIWFADDYELLSYSDYPPSIASGVDFVVSIVFIDAMHIGLQHKLFNVSRP